MKYLIIICIALSALYGWIELEKVGERRRAERKAVIEANAAKEIATIIPDAEKSYWRSFLDKSIDSQVKLMGNSIGFQSETGYAIVPLSNVILQCDAFSGIRILAHEDNNGGFNVEANLLHWLGPNSTELSVSVFSPAAKALSTDLCQQLYYRLNCLGQCVQSKELTGYER